MNTRLGTIGIKQIIRYKWLQRAANLQLAGLDVKTIRKELHEFLATGADAEETALDGGKRSHNTRTFVVNNLMNIWITPPTGLGGLRDAALMRLRDQPAMGVALHWIMISTAYPFWSNVALQVGRLLNLQHQVTQSQIVNRLIEQYGDRQTISRYARYVIRSFVDWGVLEDSSCKGCYEERDPAFVISDTDTGILLIEAALRNTSEGKATLGTLTHTPAFFPFQMPLMTGDYIAQKASNIEVAIYGFGDELLTIKGWRDIE